MNSIAKSIFVVSLILALVFSLVPSAFAVNSETSANRVKSSPAYNKKASSSITETYIDGYARDAKNAGTGALDGKTFKKGNRVRYHITINKVVGTVPTDIYLIKRNGGENSAKCVGNEKYHPTAKLAASNNGKTVNTGEFNIPLTIGGPYFYDACILVNSGYTYSGYSTSLSVIK